MNIYLDSFKEYAHIELTENILPYWIRLIDVKYGGFYGQVNGREEINKNASKGSVITARILWTFSSAYRLLGNEEYLQAATHALRFLIDKCYDHVHGGVYWEVAHDGTPLDTKKQIYALGFAIYGLSEYYRATDNGEALTYAQKLFHDIEKHSFDIKKNGYFEAFTCEWGEIKDMRLSAKDINERKTMNTHLHILEPYTNLYRVWKDEKLQNQLVNLVELFCQKFYDTETKHCILFFNDDWESKHRIVSYGHDIEASWLIHEAVLVLNDPKLLSEITPYVQHIAEAGDEGYIPNGGMIYEMNADEQIIDADRHWWVQAEAIVGYLNIYQHFKTESYLQKAIQTWKFIQENIIDHKHGEWFWSKKANGESNTADDKAGFWKCPYHNGRMCMEIMQRWE
ncbi:MAG: AGE family epimerase/isomerase [Mangrovibacterium sp.]